MVVDLYRQILKTEPRDLPSEGIPDILDAIRTMDVTEKTELLKLLDLAMEAELLSAKFYARGAKISDDIKTRKVFDELAREEDGHYNMLAAEKSSLSGDLYWFSRSDPTIMEE